jgi:ribonuclease HI
MEKEPIALEAAQASITTATVTIKTLRVNSRQLTQSTFRQLPTQQLVDEATPSLLGTVWGWVNYKPPGDAENTTQFVVQFGERLCRCPFHLRSLPSGTWTEALINMQESYCEQTAIAILTHVVRDPNCLEHYRSDGRFALTVRARGPFKGTSLTEAHARSLGINALWRHLDLASCPRPVDPVFGDTDYAQAQRERIEQIARERQQGWVQNRETAVVKTRELLEFWNENLSASTEWWQSELDREANEAADYVARWNALMETLRAAEQLYIAT